MKQQLENYLDSEIDSMLSQRIELRIDEVEDVWFSKMKIISKELLYTESNEEEILNFKAVKNKILSKQKEIEKEIVAFNRLIDNAKEILSDMEIEGDYVEIKSMSHDPLEEIISDLEYVEWELEKHKTESHIFTGSGTADAQVDYLDMDGESFILDLSVDFNYKFEEMKNKEIKIIELEITNYKIK